MSVDFLAIAREVTWSIADAGLAPTGCWGLVDLWNYRLVCKASAAATLSCAKAFDVRARLHVALTRRGISKRDANALLRLVQLKWHNLCFAGSFCMQALMYGGEFWPDSDIDIWSIGQAMNLRNLGQSTVSAFPTVPCQYGDFLEESVWNELTRIFSTPGVGFDRIHVRPYLLAEENPLRDRFTVQTWTASDSCGLDAITYRNGCVDAHEDAYVSKICSQFDFEFCAVAARVTSKGEWRVYWRDATALLTRSCRVPYPIINAQRTADRIEKYERRGFSILREPE